MIHPNASDTLTVRSVFVIGARQEGQADASPTRRRPAATSTRSSASSTAAAHRRSYKVATPANWKDGEDVIIVPAVSDEDAKEQFPKGWTTVKPYLRITPQPNK